ncbi:hypothetical protein ABZP36_027301 [Zizania latifolia]
MPPPVSAILSAACRLQNASKELPNGGLHPPVHQSAFPTRWKYEKGVQVLWDEMEKNGSGPDQRSFTIMVRGLHSHGKLDKALQYYRMMESIGMTPEPWTKILVKAIGVKREPGGVEEEEVATCIVSQQQKGGNVYTLSENSLVV